MAFRTRSPVVCAMCLFAAALLLLGLECGVGVVALTLLLRVMDWAFGIGADFCGFALLRAFGDDGFGGELAGFVLRPVAFIFVLWLLLPDFDVLVAGNHGTAIGGFTVGGADLNQLRFGGNGLLYVRIDLPLVAGRIGALLAALSCPL